MTTELTPTGLKTRLEALGLFGPISCSDEIIDKPRLREVLAIEERERQILAPIADAKQGQVSGHQRRA